MKRLLLIIALLPLMARAQLPQTYFTTTPPGTTAIPSVTFRGSGSGATRALYGYWNGFYNRIIDSVSLANGYAKLSGGNSFSGGVNLFTGGLQSSLVATSSNDVLRFVDIGLTTTGTGAATYVKVGVGPTAHYNLNIPTPDFSGYVPYTGATNSVNLGLNSITSNTITLTNSNQNIYGFGWTAYAGGRFVHNGTLSKLDLNGATGGGLQLFSTSPYLQLSTNPTGVAGADINVTLNGNNITRSSDGLKVLWQNDNISNLINDAGYVTSSGAGSTYEALANKVTTLDNSTTHYPSTSAVMTALATKQDTSLYSIAAMQAYSGGANAIVVRDTVRGGNFNLIQGSITPDNGVTFSSAISGYYWKRQYNQSNGVNIKWWPVLANGSLSDTTYIKTAIANYSKIFFPKGTYPAPNISANGKTITGIKPYYVSAQTLAGGTIFSGIVSLTGNYNIVENVGVINTGGTSHNGFNISNNASYNKIINCITSVTDHGVLIEQFGNIAHDNEIIDCQAYDGIHGFVSKSKRATFLRCRAYGQSTDGFAMVSDNINGISKPSINLDNNIINCEAYKISQGITIYSRDYTSTNNAAGIALNNLNIIGFICDTASTYGIRVGDSGSAPGGQTYNKVNNITIIGGSIHNATTQCIQLNRANGVNLSGINIQGTINRDDANCTYVNMSNINNINSSMGSVVYNKVLSSNSGTIDASSVNGTLLETGNTATTNITTINSGKVGQIIQLLINDNFTTITSGTSIRLKNATSLTGKGTWIVLKLANDFSGWDELYRGVANANLAVSKIVKTDANGNFVSAVSGTDYQAAGNYITALTGDATASGPGSAPLTLATVNSNIGSFGLADNVPTFTVNGKGLITAAANTPIQITESQVTNLTTDLASKLNIADTTTMLSGYAKLASPTFTGTPTVPTASAGTNTTQIVNGAYVQGELATNQNLVVLVKNTTGSTITKGSAVFINGSSSNLPTISLSDVSVTGDPPYHSGVTSADIADGSTGYMIISGILNNYNTSGFSLGDIYVSRTTNGLLTQSSYSNSYGTYRIKVGTVTKIDATQGTIQIFPSAPFRISEMVSHTTTALTSAMLGSAALGDRMICPSISTGGIIYTCVGTSQWVSQPITDVP